MFPVSLIVGDCINAKQPASEGKKLNTSARVLLNLVIADALISITALVIGILGLVGILHGMPPAAAYTLVGLSGFIISSWVAMAAFSKGYSLKLAKILLQAGVSSDPSILRLS